MIDAMRYLTYEDLDEIQMEFGTPCFVYDEATLRTNAREVLNFPNAYGLFPRYAMKAAPTAAILRIFNEEGLGIDASSVHEVERAVRAGYGTESISLSTQELADDFIYWAQDGIRINLCSLNQIDKIGKWGKVAGGLVVQPWQRIGRKQPNECVDRREVLGSGKMIWKRQSPSVRLPTCG